MKLSKILSDQHATVIVQLCTRLASLSRYYQKRFPFKKCDESAGLPNLTSSKIVKVDYDILWAPF